MANGYVGNVKIGSDTHKVGSTLFGTCSTAAATAAKAVTLAEFTTLLTGVMVPVRFTVTNTAAIASLTLNVNGTGAKPIKYRGGNLPSAGYLAANRIYLFVYDGTNWEVVGDLDTNTTYLAMDSAQATAASSSSGMLISPKVLAGAIAERINAFTGAGIKVDANSNNTIASEISSIWSDLAYAIGVIDGLGPAATAATTSTIANGGTGLPTAGAVYTYVNNQMSSVSGALVYKGTLGTGGTVTALPASHTKGWYYVVKAAGTFAGQACEAGDMVICNTTGTAASDAHWDVIQANLVALSNTEIDTIWNAA